MKWFGITVTSSNETVHCSSRSVDLKSDPVLILYAWSIDNSTQFHSERGFNYELWACFGVRKPRSCHGRRQNITAHGCIRIRPTLYSKSIHLTPVAPVQEKYLCRRPVCDHVRDIKFSELTTSWQMKAYLLVMKMELAQPALKAKLVDPPSLILQDMSNRLKNITYIKFSSSRFETPEFIFRVLQCVSYPSKNPKGF